MRAAVRTERRVIALPDGAVRIAVVSDTHSRPHPAAEDHLEQAEPYAILHAGDVGDVSVMQMLESIAPTHAVRGNIDGRKPETPDKLVIELLRNKRPVLRILMTHIAVYGAGLQRPARELAMKHEAGMVVCGHSHVPLIAKEQQIVVFNPGSLGPRRFQLPITFGVIEIDDGIRLRHVDCQTGQAWTPPQ